MYEKVLTVIAGLLAIGVIALFSYIIRLRRSVTIKQKDIDRRMYELAVLKEIGDRAGYSLDVHKIFDIITGSLAQLIDYSVVAYMIVEEDKLVFKADLERSVSDVFVKTVEARMVQSLNALLEKDFSKVPIDATVSGAVVVDTADTPVRSYFNIPLVISDKVVGVLTVADTKEGRYRGDETTVLYKLTNQASNAVTKLEEVVRTEKERIESMVESLGDGVLMTDTEYRIEVANPAARRAIGATPREELTIFNFSDALHADFNIRSKLEESMALSKVLTAKGVVIGEKTFDIVVAPVYREEGEEKVVIGGLAIFHDTTSEMKADQMRKDFMSMLVHELRAPIDGIKKTVEVLQDIKRKVPKKRAEKYYGLMHSNTTRMLELINDLLDASRVEAGKFVVMKQQTSLQKIIQEQAALYEVQATEADLNLVLEATDDVPEALPIDPNRIGQVMSNILSNAVKYTEGGGTIAVRTFLQGRQGTFVKKALELLPSMDYFGEPEIRGKVPAVVVAITNTGQGLGPEAIKTIFNKFVQFTTKYQRGQRGSGLGLVVAKGIVEAHGGEIGVVSREGEGITFFFTVPIK